MNWRTILLTLHRKFCRPWAVPMIQTMTIAAWVIAAVAAVYAYAAGQ